MAARRHLGLEVAANLQPEDLATVNDLAAVSSNLVQLTSDLATAPRFVVDAPTNMVPGSLTFLPYAVPANFVLRLQRQSDGSLRAAVTRSLMGAGLIRPEMLATTDFRTLARPGDVAVMLNEIGRPAVQALVLTPGGVTWPELKPWIASLLERGLQVDLSLLP